MQKLDRPEQWHQIIPLWLGSKGGDARVKPDGSLAILGPPALMGAPALGLQVDPTLTHADAVR